MFRHSFGYPKRTIFIFFLGGLFVGRYLMIAAGMVCFAAGFIGVFVPVLPTTPLLLLATFLFAKSSPRLHAWIGKTKVYQSYVVPFKENGGITLPKKLHILGASYTVMAISALLVQKPLVWGILLAVAIFLFWLMLVRIPTINTESIRTSRPAEKADWE